MSKTNRQQEYYQRFADEIIERIKAGTAPWQKPWRPGERSTLPTNMSSGREYTAGNSLYLQVAADRKGYSDPRWGTFNQIKALGGHVRKGEKGEQIVFFARHKKLVQRDENGKPKLGEDGKPVYRFERLKNPIWRTYTVFNAEQTAGLKLDRPQTSRPTWETHRRADVVIEEAGVPVRHVEGSDRAYYHLKRDEITLPSRGQFPSATHYYQTALHELGHATGHKSRIGDGSGREDRGHRPTLKEGIDKGFGSPQYAREELRAEISAMMTGQQVGVGHDPARGAAYVEGWVQALEDDPREIHRAAADAQRMTDYVLAHSRQRLEGIDRHIEKHASAERPEMSRDKTPAPERQERPVPELTR